MAATKPRQIQKVSTLRLVARTKQRLAKKNDEQSENYKGYGIIQIGTGVVYGVLGMFSYGQANSKSKKRMSDLTFVFREFQFRVLAYCPRASDLQTVVSGIAESGFVRLNSSVVDIFGGWADGTCRLC